MRKKREAKNIRIKEDLAPGIKRLFDELNLNRCYFNLESVSTIDGCIKYRFTGNPRPFEVSTYADVHQLLGTSK